jgi:hypothetical protein
MFFNVFSSRVFEPDKISLVRSVALIMLLAWLIKLANGGLAWQPPHSATEEHNATPPAASLWRNPFVIPLLLLVAAYLISTVFSVVRRAVARGLAIAVLRVPQAGRAGSGRAKQPGQDNRRDQALVRAKPIFRSHVGHWLPCVPLGVSLPI